MTIEVPKSSRRTVNEFIAWSKAQPSGRRYELMRGQVVAMAPEKNRHNLVKLEAAIALRNAVQHAHRHRRKTRGLFSFTECSS